MEFGYFLIAFIAVVIFIVFKGFVIVPQGKKYVVERLGKYTKTLDPGLHLLVPLVEQVEYKLTTKDITLDIPSQIAITMDNAQILANAVAFINITDPHKAVYGIEDYSRAIMNLIQTSLRSIIGEMKLDEALSSRDLIRSKLQNSISNDINEWGILLKTVEIQDIQPSESMQKAMEEQAASERKRRADILRAEGERQAMIEIATGKKQADILEAEGEAQAAVLQAEAQVSLARGNSEAIEQIQNAMQESAKGGEFILAENYIAALNELAQGQNAKTVLLPPNIDSVFGNMLSQALKK